ncbi:peptidase S49 [Hyphomicrobium nitrativorans NL23]|uniref:Peptidase S49 n=1 Tax=Hyphomicrobium nitrativorans NL23 TaxID=1029756 RepID=V5SB67_9HYPH|nr:S49 family peptidase [Hyphomicrobium nitrativorans]AHB48111.1 peptidase S49 [Hyphomicrobium nitrativorans NL23]
MGFFSRGVVVPVLRFSGAIGMAAPLRPGLSIASLGAAIDAAFSMSRGPSVAVVINSPGGSPVQSSLLFRRLRQLADEKRKKIYVFCEDVAASGGYYLAVAGDEIYADASSIVGSIGVISASFGLDRAIEKLGISRRVYTAGANKGALDPFQPENPEDIARLMAIQRSVHDVFIGVVKDRRLGRLKGPDGELFSGAFWSALDALELGLIDGISDVRTKMREIHGENVRLRVVPVERSWLSGRFRKLPSVLGLGGDSQGLALADDLVSAVEIRALWSRFGL